MSGERLRKKGRASVRSLPARLPARRLIFFGFSRFLFVYLEYVHTCGHGGDGLESQSSRFGSGPTYVVEFYVPGMSERFLQKQCNLQTSKGGDKAGGHHRRVGIVCSR